MKDGKNWKMSDDEWRAMKRRFDKNQRRLGELIAAAKAKLADDERRAAGA